MNDVVLPPSIETGYPVSGPLIVPPYLLRVLPVLYCLPIGPPNFLSGTTSSPSSSSSPPPITIEPTVSKPPVINAPFVNPGALRKNFVPATPFPCLSAFKPLLALSAFLKLNSALLKPLKIIPISFIVLPILRGFNHLSPTIIAPNATIPLANASTLCQVLIFSPPFNAFARLLIPITKAPPINLLIALNTPYIILNVFTIVF